MQEVDIENSIFNHFLCKSGFADDLIIAEAEEYGKCGSSIESLKAGEKCESSSNCPTNLSTVTAKCLCTPNENGDKYCSFEKGNYEWTNIVNKVKIFFC